MPPVDHGAPPEAGWRLNEWYPRTTSVSRIPQALAGVRYQSTFCVSCLFRPVPYADKATLSHCLQLMARPHWRQFTQATTGALYKVKSLIRALKE